MHEERVAKLNEGQRKCLRMVYNHMETKEIARTLGISPDGVTQRIKTAMRILGVNRRRDAALILAEAEGLTPYPWRVHPPRDVATAAGPGPFPVSIERESRHHGTALTGEMRERQSAFEAGPHAPVRGFRPPLPVWGVRPGDLGALHRLGWIFGLILAIAFVFGVFVTGVEALSRLGRAIL